MRSNRIFISVLLVFLFFYTDNSDFPDQLWYNWLNEYAYSRYAEGQNFHGWR